MDETMFFEVLLAVAMFMVCFYVHDLIRAIDDLVEAIDDHTKIVVNERRKKRATRGYQAKKRTI